MSKRVVIDRDYVRSVAAEIRDLAAQGLQPLYQPPGGGQELTTQLAGFGSDVRLCMTKEAERLEGLATDCEAFVQRAEDLDQQAENDLGGGQAIPGSGQGKDLMDAAYAEWKSSHAMDSPVQGSPVVLPGSDSNGSGSNGSGPVHNPTAMTMPGPTLTDPSWPAASVKPIWEDQPVDENASPQPSEPDVNQPHYDRPVELHLPKQPSVLSIPPAGEA